MNIYNILTDIIQKMPFNEVQMKESLEYVRYLEQINAFGVMAKQQFTSHECQFQWSKQTTQSECMHCHRPNPDQSQKEYYKRKWY